MAVVRGLHFRPPIAMDFSLRKWYLDCTAPDGRAAILYVARLCWGSLRVPYAALLTVTPPGRVEILSRYSGHARVEQEGRTLHLRAPAIGTEGSWVPSLPGIEAELLGSETGSIRWHCRQPGGSARLRLPGGDTLTGPGYAEELRLDLPPWSLPFRELRWGRFLGGGRSLVWIDWSGGLVKRWVFLDGKAVSAATPRRDGLDWPGGRLEVDRGEVIREESIGRTAAGCLRWLLPRRLRRATESKRLCRGRLEVFGEEAVEGWTIHEVVRWA
jgi:hypothetical protein